MLIKNQSYNLNPIKQIKKLVIMLSIAGIPMAGCSKDENNEPEPQHDTTYTFSYNDISAFFPDLKKIKASADSSQVRNVIIKATGSFKQWGKEDIDDVTNNALKPAFAVSPKVKGAGELDTWRPNNIFPEDRAWLETNGYKIVEKYTSASQKQR